MSDYEKIMMAFQAAGATEDEGDFNITSHENDFTIRFWMEDKLVTFYFNKKGEMITKS